MCIAFAFIWHKTRIFRNIFLLHMTKNQKCLPATSTGEKNKVPVTRWYRTVYPKCPFKSSTGKCCCSNTCKGYICAFTTLNRSVEELFSASWEHTQQSSCERDTPEQLWTHFQLSSNLWQQGDVEGTEGTQPARVASNTTIHIFLLDVAAPRAGAAENEQGGHFHPDQRLGTHREQRNKCTKNLGAEQWLMPRYIFAVSTRRLFLGRHLDYLIISPTISICNQPYYTQKAWPSYMWTTVVQCPC